MKVKRKWIVLIILSSLIVVCVSAIRKSNIGNDLVYIPPSEQRSGDTAKGYEYLITGDYVKSGPAYGYFLLLNGKDKKNYLNRTGKNATVDYSFNVVTADNEVEVVVPNCLQCHAQVFDGKLCIGLGNSMMDFTKTVKLNNLPSKAATRVMQTFSPNQYKAALPVLRTFKAIASQLQTEVQGVNAADRLAVLLVAHRDPETLAWSDTALLEIPDEVIPTDVPAWWLLKKKNAMFYNGFGRGDFGKFLMLSNLLTVKDTAEAAQTFTHFGDVLAYIKSLNPPPYPYPVDTPLVTRGKMVFINYCSKCHGEYGANGKYPNLLIPENIIKTDSLLFKSNYQNPKFIDWFNRSWYANGDHPAKLEPFGGYIAPPLDGVWVTAPYLHNASVPTLEALLNSKLRPKYWERDFKYPEYDYEQVGWKFKVKEKPDDNNKKVYNTDKPGYGNYGHYFADDLTDAERKAVIEYLKTL
ncbi:MAG TPA: hypothetical protein VH396_16710 [Chitinophagaceae bacterium]|jgi:hypothetical protein